MINSEIIWDGVEKTVGPWPCERCGELAQYAKCNHDVNKVFCSNCNFERIIDKQHHLVIENDGRRWNVIDALKPGLSWQA